MRKLNIGGVGFCQVIKILKMLIHGIYQAVANCPQSKKKSNQKENKCMISPVFSGKKSLFCFFHVNNRRLNIIFCSSKFIKLIRIAKFNLFNHDFAKLCTH